MQFPRFVYKSASEHVLAEDQDQYAALINDGWYASVPDASNAKKDKQPSKVDTKQDSAAPTREEMELKAKELGITVRKNATDESLLALINAELAK